MTVKIRHKQYRLSQRIASDVLTLSDAKVEGRQYDQVLIMVRAVSDSLKATYKYTSWTKLKEKLHYWKFRKGNDRLILNNVSIADLYEWFLAVLELEGSDVKKKVSALAKESEEKLQKD